MTLAAIPSPSTAVWNLGSVPIRAYALCIIAGIVIACIVTEARLRSRGAHRYAVLDIAVWAVPFGIVGARIYHVITSPQGYFGEDGEPLKAFQIWEGGLGIWGAVAGGALGVWFACRQLRLPFVVVADAAAVGLPLAQAVGRLGNWFNNELYGSQTTLPWGLEVHQMGADGRALTGPEGEALLLPGLYHPTFLYEALWNVGVAVLVWQLAKRFDLGRGRAFALYVMAYTAGRFWVELIRDDPANEILGARVNVWVSALVFLAALLYFSRVRGVPEFLVPAADDRRGYEVVNEAEYHAYRQRAAVAGDDGQPDAARPPDGSPAADSPAADSPAADSHAEDTPAADSRSADSRSAEPQPAETDDA